MAGAQEDRLARKLGWSEHVKSLGGNGREFGFYSKLNVS